MTLHMHLHLAAPKRHRFFNGLKRRCPWCNDERTPRLIKIIRRFLREHHGGVVKESCLREAMADRNWDTPSFRRAMAELDDVEVCASCRCLITMFNPHEESCPHSAARS